MSEEEYAFPGGWHIKGMLLRDYFAAKAMQSLINNISHLETYFRECETRDQITGKISEMSYGFADSMLEEKYK